MFIIFNMWNSQSVQGLMETIIIAPFTIPTPKVVPLDCAYVIISKSLILF